MAVVKRSASAVIEFRHGTKASEFQEFFANIPANAEISVNHFQGDQRDPSYTTIKATWSV